MLKYGFALLLILAATPYQAFAWTERPVSASQGASDHFADPDDKLDRMTESTRSNNGSGPGSSSSFPLSGHSGFSMSITPQTYGPGAFGNGVGPGFGPLADPRR